MILAMSNTVTLPAEWSTRCSIMLHVDDPVIINTDAFKVQSLN